MCAPLASSALALRTSVHSAARIWRAALEGPWALAWPTRALRGRVPATAGSQRPSDAPHSGAPNVVPDRRPISPRNENLLRLNTVAGSGSPATPLGETRRPRCPVRTPRAPLDRARQAERAWIGALTSTGGAPAPVMAQDDAPKALSTARTRAAWSAPAGARTPPWTAGGSNAPPTEGRRSSTRICHACNPPLGTPRRHDRIRSGRGPRMRAPRHGGCRFGSTLSIWATARGSAPEGSPMPGPLRSRRAASSLRVDEPTRVAGPTNGGTTRTSAQTSVFPSATHPGCPGGNLRHRAGRVGPATLTAAPVPGPETRAATARQTAPFGAARPSAVLGPDPALKKRFPLRLPHSSAFTASSIRLGHKNDRGSPPSRHAGLVPRSAPAACGAERQVVASRTTLLSSIAGQVSPQPSAGRSRPHWRSTRGRWSVPLNRGHLLMGGRRTSKHLRSNRTRAPPPPSSTLRNQGGSR